jgi:hypothetical protein
LEEWVRSGKLLEYGFRGCDGLLTMEVASRLQRQLLREIEGQAGKEAARSVAPSVFRVRAGGLGVETVLFVAGEGLIAALQGEGSSEVAGRLTEAVVVLAIAEGSVLGAEILIAGEAGAFGGPIGIGIAVAAAAAYEGVKYLWTASKEHDADHRILQARCETATHKIDQWAAKTTEAVLGSASSPQ